MNSEHVKTKGHETVNDGTETDLRSSSISPGSATWCVVTTAVTIAVLIPMWFSRYIFDDLLAAPFGIVVIILPIFLPFVLLGIFSWLSRKPRWRTWQIDFCIAALFTTVALVAGSMLATDFIYEFPVSGGRSSIFIIAAIVLISFVLVGAVFAFWSMAFTARRNYSNHNSILPR